MVEARITQHDEEVVADQQSYTDPDEYPTSMRVTQHSEEVAADQQTYIDPVEYPTSMRVTQNIIEVVYLHMGDPCFPASWLLVGEGGGVGQLWLNTYGGHVDVAGDWNAKTGNLAGNAVLLRTPDPYATDELEL